MIERRAESRTRLDVSGVILADEHRAMACVISDRSPTGIRVTVPDTDDLPDTFILTFDDTGESLVCRAAWRKVDQIGCIADVLVSAWLEGSPQPRQPAWA